MLNRNVRLYEDTKILSFGQEYNRIKLQSSGHEEYKYRLISCRYNWSVDHHVQKPEGVKLGLPKDGHRAQDNPENDGEIHSRF